mgnify:CR=1 FL=1
MFIALIVTNTCTSSTICILVAARVSEVQVSHQTPWNQQRNGHRKVKHFSLHIHEMIKIGFLYCTHVETSTFTIIKLKLHYPFVLRTSALKQTK